MVSHILRISGIEWKNIRNYEQIPNPEKGIKKFDFSSKKHSLLQIQNNYGKTTTMHLLRSTFTGMEIDKVHIEGYNYRQNTTEWGGRPDQKGSFKVFFQMDDEFFAIESVLDPVAKTHQFFTFREITEGDPNGGRKKGWKPPKFFKHLFENKPDFVDLFVLDGEKARELNRDASTQKIATAIRQVTGLWDICDLIDEGSRKGRISDLVVNVLSKDIGSRGGRSAMLKKHLEECLEHKKNLENKAEEHQNQIKKFRAALVENEEKLKQFDSEKIEQNKLLSSAQDEEVGAKNRLKEETLQTLAALCNPANIVADSLWRDVIAFYNSQIQGKMPKGMTKNWLLNEVVNREACICGTPWDKEEKMKSHLIRTADDYLDEVLMPRVKQMQATIVDSKSQSSISELKNRLDARREELSEAGRRVRAIRDEFPEDDKKLYEELIETKTKLEIAIRDKELEYNWIKSTNRDFIMDHHLHVFTLNSQNVPYTQPDRFIQIDNIFELEKVERYIRETLLESSASAAKAKGARILQTVLTKSVERIIKEISAELEIRMNTVAKKMPGLNSNIRISESGLEFRSPAGNIQEGLNESAGLGAIYGLVASLNAYSDVSLPIVVDTPLAGFGRGMARAWQQVVISTFDQTISLLNSSEKFDLEFWWKDQPSDTQFFTFLRMNEDHLTGRDHDWSEDSDQETTGAMYVDGSIEVFAAYEKAVGENDRGDR